ncbi:MAG: Crp/Fnr family transcriptional regulator [Fibrobacteraceae bacterium]|mgnify:CR=1 FL=1|nr:Crp/Fnr family transcriptional regulator [Fibrobacteraceae bacterium]
MQINKGEYLTLEGDKGNTLFIVKSGMLVAQRSTPEDGDYLENIGPGTIIGELSLLESAPREYTVKAAEPSELIVITQDMLEATLSNKPSWLKSILDFLTSRYHIAQKNKKKNDLIQALPTLLFVISSKVRQSGVDTVLLDELYIQLKCLNNTSAEETDRLLHSLENLGVLKVQENGSSQKILRVESLQLVPLLYETLRYRALNKKISPNILSMTDQMILTTFIKVAKEKGKSLEGGFCSVSTADLTAEAKKSMHGLTLTSRTMYSLVEKQLLNPSQTFKIQDSLETVPSFYADFDKILDLLELNRVFPLLDKKLVEI